MKKLIDISENNGNFDLNIIKQNGYAGVIIRLGWIGNHNNHHKDLQLGNYYQQAKNLGLTTDFYVYSYCESKDALKSGIEFIDKIIEELQIPTRRQIYLDLEDTQISYLSKDDLTEQAEYFCNYYTLRGYAAGIYANKNWFENKLEINRLSEYLIWLAEWGVKKPSVNFKVDIWQYTDEEYINEKIFDSNESYIENINTTLKKEEFEVKNYVNGTTVEIVYQDVKCTKQIGYLHPKEQAKCYGIIDNKALIVYTIDGTNNQKSGFVKWLGGII